MKSQFYILDTTKEDVRCQVCRHHKYLVVSTHPVGVSVVHTQAHLVEAYNGEGWAFSGGRYPVIHKFGLVGGVVKSPKCLESYKVIGGK